MDRGISGHKSWSAISVSIADACPELIFPSDLILGESLHLFGHLSGDKEHIFLSLVEKRYFDRQSERLQDNKIIRQYSLRIQT